MHSFRLTRTCGAMRTRPRSDDGRFEEFAQVYGCIHTLRRGGPRRAAEKGSGSQCKLISLLRQGLVRPTACCPNHAQSCHRHAWRRVRGSRARARRQQGSNNMDIERDCAQSRQIRQISRIHESQRRSDEGGRARFGRTGSANR